MKMFRSSVYIRGRYCKYDRELPPGVYILPRYLIVFHVSKLAILISFQVFAAIVSQLVCFF